jgi:hypothetical protein
LAGPPLFSSGGRHQISLFSMDGSQEALQAFISCAALLGHSSILKSAGGINFHGHGCNSSCCRPQLFSGSLPSLWRR